MADEQQQIHVRVDAQMHRRITDAARQRGVSAAYEINERLARSFPRRDPIADIAADVKQLLKLQGGAE